MTTHQPDSHYLPLKNAIPAWLGKATAAKRQAFAVATPTPLPTASAAQRAEFKRLSGAHWTAQNAVDNALKQVQDARTFARPILEDALINQFGVDLDAQRTCLRLYSPKNIPWLPIASGAARPWTISLLDAALVNFDHGQAQENGFEPASTFITEPDANGQFVTLPAIREKISVARFARLCRELDIGARYQRYLKDALGLNEPVAGAALQLKVEASQKAALRSALHLAQLRGDIQPDFAQVVTALMDGRSEPRLDDQTIRLQTLSVMQAPLTGILLFAADLEQARAVPRLVAYIPNDPHAPLKEYPSPLAFKQALTQRLRGADYQAFFSRFVAHEHRGLFFSGLSQRLARIKWHPPQAGSGLAPWRKTPTDDPKLQFSSTSLSGDVWQTIYQQQINKILNDARTTAVPTAAVDLKARWALWDSFVNVASSILNAALFVVAPFIPGLGELMLGYMAYQLLDDVFEGIVDWAEGLPQEAFGHLMSVLQALVQVGAFAAGGTIGAAELRKVLPQSVLDFVDRHTPVTLANGARRYWKPDLAPYRQNIDLPANLGIDHLGLHQVRGESILPLDGHFYAVQRLANDAGYAIKHPTRSDAYMPRLRHNGAGSWHTELEHPLQWDCRTLLQRIGHRAEGLGAADRELALSLSDVPEGALRKMHLNSEPVPPLLDDSLARLRIDRSIQTLIERLNSDDPAQYGQVDPQDQLQLLTAFGDWPHARGLRFLNAAGETTWAFGDQDAPVVQIHEAQLTNGELLKTVLESLSEEEIRSHFGERASDPRLSLETRVKHLRKRLARIAERNRAPLFDSRYGLLQQTQAPAVRQLLDTVPTLPARCAERLIDHASGEELQALEERRTPERLADQAAQALDALRLNRAYEGLHMDAVQSLDSDRLALNSLRIQPGWSGRIRLELKHRSPHSPSWHRIGPDDAPLLRSLVRTEAGRYVPHDEKGPLSGETDLYSAILGALPDAHRDALGIQIHQAAELRERLRQHPLPRAELRKVLENGTPRPPRRVTMRLLGQDAGFSRQVTAHVLMERAQRLFPGLGEPQLNDLLAHLNTQPGGAANQLAALAAEYQQLEHQLGTWQNEVQTHHPRSGALLTTRQRRYEQQNRRLISDQFKRCWRRETDIDDYYEDPNRDGHRLRLDYPITGALPRLGANFDHVTFLSLTGSVDTHGAQGFLGHFTRLRHLEVKGIPLGDIPPSINSQSALNNLILSNCQIRLTEASHTRLAAMSQLQTLVLHSNPLGRAPSVQGMPRLNALDLSETGIGQLPAGILDRPQLLAALLGDNQITELPDALFELPAETSKKFDLSGNPLSSATLERVKAYFQRHDTYWEIDAPAVDTRDANLLFPAMDHDELNRLVYALPGDIEAGRRELARLAQELDTLQQQLDEWARGDSLAAAEHGRRQALRRVLEASWRRYPQPNTHHVHVLRIPRSVAGDLPSLNARFNHITTLFVEGDGTAAQVDRFLHSFPALEILEMSHTPLGDIPPTALAMPQLTFLVLPRCSITLTAASRSGLERMAQLQYLDLKHNPLGELPDFSQLPGVATVLLKDTGLSELPDSLFGDFARREVDLSDNALHTLPQALFNLPSTSAHAFNLAGNPLSRASLEQIKSHYRRTFQHFNVAAPLADRTRAQALYPRLLEQEADRFIFSLPGDLDAVAPTLTRLEAEYQQLTIDLQRWANVPERHPITDEPLDEATRAREQLARDEFKSLMEQAWRRESPEDEESMDDAVTHALTFDVPIMGALPELSARLDHVSSFELRGGGTVTAVDGTLQCFTQLQSLFINQCAVHEVPQSIFSMPRLSNLDLSQCDIRLTVASASSFRDLHALEFLELSHNPLGNAPDVSGLNQLVSLHLHDCELRELPHAVFQLPQLYTLDLSNNLISELPADPFERAEAYQEDSDLSGNPWSSNSLDYLRQYFQRTGVDFQVPEATVDAEGQVLQPPFPDPMEE
ncbi:dermonecrotic toxin domain-containing protein [Pseudomonas sp. MPB26]|uniref:dermonecrotic toxin domain-containing protein n=1 Tax=Pseudomonas sp. MPB26 TaxID=3388491 RepID=UPI003985567D